MRDDHQGEKVPVPEGLADDFVVATPIYNYEVGGATRNLIALGGSAFRDKVVGVCAAGGQRPYMSVMALANSLMLDFRSVIVPRFVYATGLAATAWVPAS
jgi:FMN reductase